MKKDWNSIKWLYEELPELVADGILQQDAADSLKRRYGEIPKRDSSTLALTVFSAFGAILAGAGLVMLLAHNWDCFGRLARTIIALASPFAGLCALGFAIMKKESRAFAIEPLCAFQTLAVGAALAIVGQTYNVGGDLPGLLFVWCVAAIPLAWLFDSVLAAALCLAVFAIRCCVCAGAGSCYAADDWRTWALLALLVPYAAKVMLKERGSNRAAFLGWAAAISTTIAATASFSFTGHSAWEFAMPCFFSALFLAGAIPSGDALPAWRNPLRFAGAVGAGALSIVLSTNGYFEPKFWSPDNPGEFALAYMLLALCAGGVALLCVKKSFWEIPFAALGPVAFVSVAIASSIYVGRSDLLKTFFSPVALALGVLTAVSGIRSGLFGRLNGGLLLLAAWTLSKYFDNDLSLLFKGVLFLALGAAFIVFNLLLLKKRRAQTHGKEAQP